MEDKIRVAVIGTGGLATNIHLPCLASLPDVELTATCDLIEERAKEAAAKFHIPRVFTDFEEMLEEVDPQVVYAIMMPQHLYAPAAAVLQQGRHLFVEKPLGLTTKQAQMLAYFAEENSCLTAVGFQRRHIPALTYLKSKLEEQGPIHQATVSYLKGGRDLNEPAGIYGGVIDNLTCDMIHAVDNLRFLSEERWKNWPPMFALATCPDRTTMNTPLWSLSAPGRGRLELQLRNWRRRVSSGVSRPQHFCLRGCCQRVLHQEEQG